MTAAGEELDQVGRVSRRVHPALGGVVAAHVLLAGEIGQRRGRQRMHFRFFQERRGVVARDDHREHQRCKRSTEHIVCLCRADVRRQILRPLRDQFT